MGANNKRIVAPWIVAAVMALLFMGTLVSVTTQIARAVMYDTVTYVQACDGYERCPAFIDPDDLIYI